MLSMLICITLVISIAIPAVRILPLHYNLLLSRKLYRRLCKNARPGFRHRPKFSKLNEIRSDESREVAEVAYILPST